MSVSVSVSVSSFSLLPLSLLGAEETDTDDTEEEASSPFPLSAVAHPCFLLLWLLKLYIETEKQSRAENRVFVTCFVRVLLFLSFFLSFFHVLCAFVLLCFVLVLVSALSSSERPRDRSSLRNSHPVRSIQQSSISLEHCFHPIQSNSCNVLLFRALF